MGFSYVATAVVFLLFWMLLFKKKIVIILGQNTNSIYSHIHNPMLLVHLTNQKKY